MNRFVLVQAVEAAAGRPGVRPWNPTPPEEPGLTSTHAVLGVTTTSSEDDQIAVMRRGLLRDVFPPDGESWGVGNILWGSADGVVTVTRQAAPWPQVMVGVVYDVYDESFGSPVSVVVNVTVLPAIGELSGVKIEAPEDRDVLIYDPVGQAWEPRRLEMRDIRDGRRFAWMMGGR